MSTNTPMGEVTLKNVRLAFSDNLFEAGINKNIQQKAGEKPPKPQFSSTFLVPKGSEADKELRAAMMEVAVAKWGKAAEKNLEVARGSTNTNCYQDGDSAAKRDYDGYAGHYALAAKNTKRPTVVDRDRTPLTESEGRPYSGCYVMAKVSLWAQDNSNGRAIRASLLGVQFYKDGDAFGAGRVATVDEFEDLGVDEDAVDDMDGIA